MANHFSSARFTYETSAQISETREKFGAAELHFSGSVVAAGHPDVQKIWLIVVFFENRLHWQFEAEKISTNCCFRLHIYLRTNKT